MQLDSAWPVEGKRESQRSTDERGQHVNVLPCKATHTTAPSSVVLPSSLGVHGCPCGVVPAPLLNTGFVYVRAKPGRTSAQQLIYNHSVDRILRRVAGEPTTYTTKGEVDPHPVWAQDTVNEAAADMATLPAGWSPGCHAKDTACAHHYRK